MSLILIGLTLLSNGMIDLAIDICEMNSNESYIIDNNQQKNYCCCNKPEESDCCKTTYFYYFTPKFIEDNQTLSFIKPELNYSCKYFNIHSTDDTEKFSSYLDRPYVPNNRWRLRSFVKQEVKCVWII